MLFTITLIDAFFVSTDSNQFNGSWLVYFTIPVHPNMGSYEILISICLAGTSATLGK